jgi:hypothetical protein
MAGTDPFLPLIPAKAGTQDRSETGLTQEVSAATLWTFVAGAVLIVLDPGP